MRSFRPGFRNHGSLDIKSVNTVVKNIHGPSSLQIFPNRQKIDTTFTQRTLFPLKLPSRHFTTQNHPIAQPKKKSKRPSNLTPIGVEDFVKEVQRLQKVHEDASLTDEQKAEQIFHAIKRTLPFYDITSEDKIRHEILEMQLLLARGQLAEALKKTDAILAKNIPNLKIRVDLFAKKAQIHFTMQHYERGLDAADEALKLDPISFDARICRALCTLGLKNHEDALNQIESIISELNEQVDPRRDHLATAFNAKGTVLYASGDSAGARYWMQKGLQYNPDGSLQHIMLRGVEFLERKKYQKALQVFEEDLQKLEGSPPEVAIPARPKLLLLKAKALVHLTRYSDAIACLDDMATSPALFPLDRGYMVAEKSRALLGMGKAGEAMKLVQEALAANPEIGKILLEEKIITNLPEAPRIQFKKPIENKSSTTTSKPSQPKEQSSNVKPDEK